MWRKEFSYSKSHQLKNSAVKAIREKLESPPARTPTSAPPTLTWEDIFNGPLTVATVAGSRTEVILDAKKEPLLINAEGRGAFALTRAPLPFPSPLTPLSIWSLAGRLGVPRALCIRCHA